MCQVCILHWRRENLKSIVYQSRERKKGGRGVEGERDRLFFYLFWVTAVAKFRWIRCCRTGLGIHFNSQQNLTFFHGWLDRVLKLA